MQQTLCVRCLLPPQAERSEAEEAIHRRYPGRERIQPEVNLKLFLNFVSCSSADFAGAENYCFDITS